MASKYAKGHLVRIGDVAKYAGVSTATVSRVINNSVEVPELTRSKVLTAVEKTGFVRNAFAGRLAGLRSNAVAVIVPSISNPVFAESIQSIVGVLNTRNMSVFIGSSDYDISRERDLIRSFLEWRVDGLILTGAVRSEQAERQLLASGIPFVVMWEFDKRRGRATVSFDNRLAAYAMTERLISLGHRRIGFVSSPVANNDRAAGRLKGYRQALAAHGIQEEAKLIAEATPFGLSDGRRAMTLILNELPWPTAVFFGNDMLAAGALLECAERGLIVPRDISIAGFDDIELARNLSPPLTTVRIPTAEMSRLAAQSLLDLADGKRVRKRKIDFEIVMRASTAPPSTLKEAASAT